VVYVTWDDAMAYCEWAGTRLPTEAQREKAASWDDAKKAKRRYPWGDEFDANKCNTRESGIGDTTPVGKYSPQGDSAYGVGDMAGNVWEWCVDWYAEDYYKKSPEKNPEGPDSGQYRVFRGGAWRYAATITRCAARFWGATGTFNDFIGFRVFSPALLLLSEF
jgi:formylglycine-generating enzyme required for sulfatase activity